MSPVAKSLTLGFALLLAACGDSGKEVASGTFTDSDGETGSYKVTEKDGTTSINVKTEDGTASIKTGADAIKEMPDGLALYPGAKVDSSSSLVSKNVNGEQGRVIAFETSDSPEKVMAFYKNAATEKGYKITAEIVSGGGHMLSAEHEKSSSAMHLAVASNENGISNATLIVSEQ